jgi:protease-4
VNRHLTADSVRQLIDAAPLVSAEALDCGLVDELAYRDDAKEKFTGTKCGLMSRPVSLDAYVNREIYDDHWGPRPRLALVIADGDITSGHSGGRIGDFEMLGTLRRVRQDPGIKGVLLRVNSPGGSALASDLIWHEIEKTAEKKPVVISMGNMAASGGYYISSVDGEIFVDRATLTGSIGVFGGKVNVARLFDKIGIYTETYSRGQNADLYSMYHPFTEEQRRQFREQLWQFYGHFTDLVGTARKISPDSVNVLGRGQVWTGVEAVANGLADGIGGVHQAMEALSRKTGIEREKAEVVAFPEERYFFPNPFDFPVIYNKLANLIGGSEGRLAAVDFFGSDYIFFRMPYNIEIE